MAVSLSPRDSWFPLFFFLHFFSGTEPLGICDMGFYRLDALHATNSVTALTEITALCSLAKLLYAKLVDVEKANRSCVHRHGV